MNKRGVIMRLTQRGGQYKMTRSGQCKKAKGYKKPFRFSRNSSYYF